ncbi:zinc finger-containing ubiquitin peptidase 1 [Brachyhypopomus gauderio]|uniref:zinc finger-containing ubiquitin peptidase 1 n=1 Tax=Brachyhypopomus gauderio TaxID=698409 RepID=UPI0040413DCB
MPVCEICSEELVSESDMRTHLLLNHLENEMNCPFCSLSGVSYDDLYFHVCTAHKEMDLQHSADHSTIRNLCGSSEVTETNPRLRTDSAKETSEGSPSVCIDMVTPASTEASGRHTLCLMSRTPAPNARTALSRGATSRVEASPPAAAASNQIKKPLGNDPAPDGLAQPSREETAEHHTSKQKRGRFTCPMCALVCADCFILQEHVELHLQDQAESEAVRLYECPLCAVTCADSSSLQDHVEVHLQYGPAAPEGVSCSDLRLAMQLQEEEEQRRKETESRQEAEHFKRLQRQFGLDNGGGYRRQVEKSMERAVSRGHMTPSDFHRKRVEMMESLASGVDDGRTRTTGLLAAVYQFYQREARDCARVWLCADTDHYSTSDGDRGWGCGYRNFQMLLSSLQRMEQYTALNTLPDSTPSIPRVQALIEAAWAEGMDPQGASHFSGRLQGTRAWIGATEMYAVLTTHRVRARIVDFHQPTGPSGTHSKLFEWVKNYFSLPSSKGSRLPPRVVKTILPPIYLQHQGHSRSIVGVEERRNGSVCLLLLDPGSSPADVRKLLTHSAASASITRMRRFPGHLKHRQYQVVVAEGVLTPEEKRNRVLNSRTLHAERIP